MEVVDVSGSNWPPPSYAAAPDEWASPPPSASRIAWLVGWGLVGAAPALVLTVTPVLLLEQYVESFTATATPDSGFNVYTLGALACLLGAGLLLLVAFISLFFRPTRALGVGYLSGLLPAVLTLVVLALRR